MEFICNWELGRRRDNKQASKYSMSDGAIQAIEKKLATRDGKCLSTYPVLPSPTLPSDILKLICCVAVLYCHCPIIK